MRFQRFREYFLFSYYFLFLESNSFERQKELTSKTLYLKIKSVENKTGNELSGSVSRRYLE